MCGRPLMSIDPPVIYSGPGLMAVVPALTFRKQKLHGTEVTLAGGHHQQGPALLVAHVDIGAALQQLLRDLETGSPGVTQETNTRPRATEGGSRGPL